MSFLHNLRRSTDIKYRWDTAAEQGIMDSQDDLLEEIRQLRVAISELTNSAPEREPYFPGVSEENLRHARKFMAKFENE